VRWKKTWREVVDGAHFFIEKVSENKNRIHLQRGMRSEVSLAGVSLNRLSTEAGWKMSNFIGTKEKMLKRFKA
jgi:hypothetical protein